MGVLGSSSGGSGAPEPSGYAGSKGGCSLVGIGPFGMFGVVIVFFILAHLLLFCKLKLHVVFSGGAV